MADYHILMGLYPESIPTGQLFIESECQGNGLFTTFQITVKDIAGAVGQIALVMELGRNIRLGPSGPKKAKNDHHQPPHFPDLVCWTDKCIGSASR